MRIVLNVFLVQTRQARICLCRSRRTALLAFALLVGTSDRTWGQTPCDDIPAGAVLVEGDILVPESFAQMRGTYTTQIWTGGVIPYEFDAAVTTTNRARALLAMADWEPLADIQFVARAGHANYVYITNGAINSSYVGMIGGRQELTMRDWDRHFVIVHELGHALGLWHEQSRTDRDQYVRIETANIQPGVENNFQIQPASSHFGIKE